MRCRAAEAIVVCLYDHASSMDVLGSEDVVGTLGGKTVIQLTTDTADEADALADWAAGREIGVLEGAILAYPAEIGTDRATIAYSGPRELYDGVAHIRDAFGGQSFHTGENAGAASVIDVSVLGVFYACAMSYLQGAALCQRAGAGHAVDDDRQPVERAFAGRGTRAAQAPRRARERRRADHAGAYRTPGRRARGRAAGP